MLGSARQIRGAFQLPDGTLKKIPRGKPYGGLSAPILLAFIFALQACVTAGGPRAGTDEASAGASDFVPTSYHSRIHRGDSRYPNLFSMESFAVWVSDDVAELKRQKEIEGGATIEMSIDEAASIIGENYYVFECHFESVFPDSSIAFDIVGLRNVELYLLTQDGTRVRPVQRIMDSHADEKQQNALRLFRRINVVVFPKRDIISGLQTIPKGTSALRLVVESFNSEFYFEWIAEPDVEVVLTDEEIEAAEPSRASIEASEAYQFVKVGFTELFTKLRALADHMQ